MEKITDKLPPLVKEEEFWFGLWITEKIGTKELVNKLLTETEKEVKYA